MLRKNTELMKNVIRWILRENTELMKSTIRWLMILVLLPLGFYFGIGMLEAEKFTGVEFIAWSTLLLFAGIAMVFLSEIQEMSVGGFLIRLDQAKKDSEVLLHNIEVAKVDIYAALLDGVWGGDGAFYVDGREEPTVKRFWGVWEKIVQNGIEQQLAPQVLNMLLTLARLQLLRVSHCGGNVGRYHPASPNFYGGEDLDYLPEPWRLDAEAYPAFHARPEKAPGQSIEVLAASLQEYKKLYELYCRLKGAVA